MNATKIRKLDALPDTVDFRDVMYSPALIEVPGASDISHYRGIRIPVLDQGREGACTGFALASVANYLLTMRGKRPLGDAVSAAMLYVMAKRYDEWPGEDYEGSSARGAMKGWHKHGVCAHRIWQDAKRDTNLSDERAADAIRRPLGAYYRVNHRDLVSMHAAITEVGVLYATASVHTGWMDLKPGDETIRYAPDRIGGHAFAIVGYDFDGFWIQNSWGEKWGSAGLARISYSDWLENGTDVWVAALGAPVSLHQASASAVMRSGAPKSYESFIYSALRPHIVTAKNDGQLDAKGAYGLTKEGLRNILEDQMPRRMEGWSRKRLLLYAHGGLVPEASAVQHVANNRGAALAAEVYPLSFIWRSDAWTTIRNLLQDAFSKRRDEGLIDRAKDFMLDRLDDTLEPVARALGGRAMWNEMKENALRATTRAGGAGRLVADRLVTMRKDGRLDEIHLVGHSAGSIFLAPLAQRVAASGIKIESLTLWAPACTMALFEDAYLPLLRAGSIKSFYLYTLDDHAEEKDDCAGIYHKSLLCLVSAALETVARIPLIQEGTPLLGIARDVAKHLDGNFWKKAGRNWYLAPSSEQSDARSHGDFDNDPATLISTLRHVTGTPRATFETAASTALPAGVLVRQRQLLESAFRASGAPQGVPR